MLKNFLIIFIAIICAGCQSSGGNIGQLMRYPYPKVESEWIRNGEPIEFEKELWYATDYTETFTDSEVMLIGEYRNVQVFIDRRDVRPYERLYTKFSPHQFRCFEKKTDNDKSS